MNRWTWVVGSFAALVAIAFFWTVRPSTGPAATVEEPAIERSTAGDVPGVGARMSAPAEGGAAPAPSPPPFRTPATNPYTLADRQQAFPADAKGITTAALSRRSDILGCMAGHDERSGGDRGFDGRFTLEVSISPNNEGGTDVSTVVMNGPKDEVLDDCVQRAIADAHFERPDHTVTVRWPVPLPADAP